MKKNRKIFRKKKYVALVLMILAVLLVGCGDSKKSAEEAEMIKLYNKSIEGEWLYADGEGVINFDGVKEYSYIKQEKTIKGSYQYDGKLLKLYEKEKLLLSGEKNSDGLLEFVGMDGYFYQGASEDDANPSDFELSYFEKNNLNCNFEMGSAATYLKNGSSYYKEDGSSFSLAPVDWEIGITRDQNTGDGFRELEFTAICYFPEMYNPNLSGASKYGCSFSMCDYYTGFELPSSVNFGNAKRGENFYHYEFEANHEPVQVDYSYSTEWENDIGEYSHTLTVKFWVRIPVNYDGLVFCALPRAESYEETVRRGIEAEGIIEFRPILKTNLDFVNALRCRIY